MDKACRLGAHCYCLGTTFNILYQQWCYPFYISCPLLPHYLQQLHAGHSSDSNISHALPGIDQQFHAVQNKHRELPALNNALTIIRIWFCGHQVVFYWLNNVWNSAVKISCMRIPNNINSLSLEIIFAPNRVILFQCCNILYYFKQLQSYIAL